MGKKRLTYKELELDLYHSEKRAKRWEKYFDRAYWILSIFSLILAIALITSITTNDILETENEALREKIPTWTLDYICDWSNIGTELTTHYEFTDYENYKEQLRFATEVLDCEVIE